MSDKVVDARGLLCPMPVIRLQDRAGQMHAGDQLEVRATDPGVKEDIPAWCRMAGHRVLETRETDDGELTLIIELGGAQ